MTIVMASNWKYIFILVSIHNSCIVYFEKIFCADSSWKFIFSVMEKSLKIIVEKEWSPCTQLGTINWLTRLAFNIRPPPPQMHVFSYTQIFHLLLLDLDMNLTQIFWRMHRGILRILFQAQGFQKSVNGTDRQTGATQIHCHSQNCGWWRILWNHTGLKQAQNLALDKHKTGLVACYDVWPGDVVGVFWSRHGVQLYWQLIVNCAGFDEAHDAAEKVESLVNR